MTPPDDVELLCHWLLGALDAAEAEAVRARITEGVPSTLAALAEARRVVGSLAHATPEVAPPVGGLDRLLAAARREPPAPAASGPSGDVGAEPQRSRRGPPTGSPRLVSRRGRVLVPALIGATFVILAGLSLWRAFKPAGDSPEETRLGRLLLDPRTERWVFKDPTTGEELGLAIRDPESKRAWISLRRLPEPEAGRTYVLWTIAQGAGRAPENRGAVVLRRDRPVDLELPPSIDLPDVAALAISLETDPATPVPTVVKALAKSPRS